MKRTISLRLFFAVIAILALALVALFLHHHRTQRKWHFQTREFHSLYWTFYGGTFELNTSMNELLALHSAYSAGEFEGLKIYTFIETTHPDAIPLCAFVIGVKPNEQIAFAVQHHDTAGSHLVAGNYPKGWSLDQDEPVVAKHPNPY